MARIPNPYQSGYNDPAMASVANNIARLAFGGESPNEAAMREAQLTNIGADTEAARALARERAAKARLTGQTVGARGDQGVASYISKVGGFDPEVVSAVLSGMADEVDPAVAQRIRDEYRTYGGIRMAGPGTQNIRDVTRSAFDSRQMGDLLMGDAPEAVAQRTAAIEGRPQYDIKGDTFFSMFDADQPRVTTEVGRANMGKTGAPIKVVGPDGRTIYVTPAQALGMEAPGDKPDRMSPGDAARLDELVYTMLGGGKDNANEFDPAALAQISARAAEYVEQGENPLTAAQLAIKENPLTEYVEDDNWLWGVGDQVPRTLQQARPAAGIPQGGAQPPDAAIQMLRQDPSLAAKFDEKYGTGAAARYLER